MFTLSRSHYADLLSEIRESISNQENLTDRNMELNLARRGRCRGKLCTLLRTVSESLYRALESSLNCSCGHDVGLRLEGRTAEVFPADDEDRILGSATFKIAVSYTEYPEVTKIWEEIGAKPKTIAATTACSVGCPWLLLLHTGAKKRRVSGLLARQKGPHLQPYSSTHRAARPA